MLEVAARRTCPMGGLTGTCPTVLLGLRILFLAVAPIAVVALSLSFFPPNRYLDGIRERHAQSKAA